MNVVIQALLHVQPLRDYFIFHSQPHPPKQQQQSKGTSAVATAPSISTTGDFDHDNRSELVKRFGMLARKLWNPKNFKSQVSPHEFLQEVSVASNKKFKITEQGDPLDFLSWLLNALHRDLGGTRKPNSSIIYSIFQGELKMQDQQIQVKTDLLSGEGRTQFNLNQDIKTTQSPFLFLAIDLPPIRVFQESTEKNNIIPQVPISEVLAKFNGETTQENAGRLRRYKLTKLPPFIIMHIKRFTSNNFVEEKNPTIVAFPLKGVDMRECGLLTRLVFTCRSILILIKICVHRYRPSSGRSIVHNGIRPRREYHTRIDSRYSA
jgi:U4/U6.U5 tri-snRNP-associated protein 2